MSRYIDKISPILEPFLLQGNKKETQKVIVVLDDEGLPLDLLRSHGKGGEADNERATKLREMHRQSVDLGSKLSASYKRLLKRSTPSELTETKATTIGSGLLPVFSIEVSSQTLIEIARFDSVVSIMPNPRVKLIDPHVVEFEPIDADEIKAEVT